METAVKLAMAMQVYSQKELQKTSVHTKNIDVLLEKTGIRSGSFDSMFPAMFSLHGLDIRDAIDKAVASKDITPNAAAVAIEGFNRAIEELSNKYPVLDSLIFSRIENILNEFANILSYSATEVSTANIAELKAKLAEIKGIFKKPYIVAYSKGSDTRVPSIKLLHNSFTNLRDIINPVIKKHVYAILKERKITNSKLLEGNYLTTKIINWGHTRTGDSIISGKLIASLMSLKNTGVKSTEAFNIIARDFIRETGQEKTIIKMHHGDLTKGDPNVLKLVISSNLFQSVIVQNTRENQVELGQLEKKWSLLEAINRGGDGLLKAFGVKNVDELVNKLINTRSSPSPVENIGSVLTSIIAGTNHKSTKKTVPLLNATTKIKKPSKSIQVKSNNTSRLKTDIGNSLAVQTNLAELQVLLNQHLQHVIAANMGDGGQSKILNYQTGRFAASAKVERLSESRAGMITAFYTYMKNPYQTFEPGFAQGKPASRDPKALISKSIKEIAATKVGNRMRAVLV